MIAMKAKPVSAPERYVNSVDAEIDRLKQGEFEAPLWLQATLAALIEEALVQYLDTPSCTVGMYLWGKSIEPPQGADEDGFWSLTRQERANLRHLLARHGLGARRSGNKARLFPLNEVEYLELLEEGAS